MNIYEPYFGYYKDEDSRIKQGFGVAYNSDGILYEGQYDNDHAHGFGRLYHDNGDYYEGYFHEGQPQGQGKIVTMRGRISSGVFSQGQKNGEFIEKFILSNGEHVSVKCWFTRNTLQENATIEYNDKGKYQGEADQQYKRQGKGIYTFPDGITKYDGEWANNMMNGQGTYFYKNGDKFTGNFQNGKRLGKGTYYNSADNSWIESYFDGCSMSGNTTTVLEDGTKETTMLTNKIPFNNAG